MGLGIDPTTGPVDAVGDAIDVALVSMPYAAVQRPSIALGQLKAALSQDGLRAKAFYPNLLFLDFVGMETYRLFEKVRTEDLLADWLFSGVAFPDFETDHARYLERLMARNRALTKDQDPEALTARFSELRKQIPDFVDWAADKVLATRPAIVGATSTFQQHVAALALLRRIKERAPGVVTMLGGANCETVMGRATHQAFPWVDYVVSGEADGLIAQLCRDVLRDGADLSAADLPEGVFGPVHRAQGYPQTGNGDGLPRATTQDMASVPLPDYDDYFQAHADSLYCKHIRPGLSIETARGCWWGMKQHCTFCGLNGGSMAFRAKPAAQVLGEIDVLVARYGISSLEAVDNILDANYLKTLLPALATSKRGLNLFYETKANLKPGELRQLAAAGVNWIQPGIESLHSDVLKLMRKGVTAWNNVRLLRLCRQYGLRVSWSLLTEFPGEDDAWYGEMAAWIPWLSHLQPGGVAALRFDRYSPYFNDAARFDLELTPSELYSYVYPLPPGELADQAYFFEEVGRQDHGRSLLHGETTERPGLEAVRNAVRDWVMAWREGALPVLTMREDAGALVVEDTRLCATAATHRLVGVSKRLLEAGEMTPPRSRLFAELAREGISESEAEAALAGLVERRLVLEVDERVLTLPLHNPVPSLPSVVDFPGGYFFQHPQEDALIAVAS